jgi:hypothetical protein
MSEVQTRRFHTPGIKAEVALEALRGVRTINEMGQEFEVHPNCRVLEEGASRTGKNDFCRKARPCSDRPCREPELLYSEIGKLKVDLDWLKKNPGSAAKEPAILDR